MIKLGSAMATKAHQFVTVTFGETSHRGVHYATDPESGWVSVLVPATPPRLLLVRPELVTFSGEICSDPPMLVSSSFVQEATGDASDDSSFAPKVGEMVAALERRGMEAEAVGECLHLLGGIVKIHPPFGERDLRSQNETILARIAPLLREIRKEIAEERLQTLRVTQVSKPGNS